MARVNFYLDKPDSENRRPIFLFFSFNGNRIKTTTNQSVLAKDWNPETMRVRRSQDGSVEINLLLDKMQSDVESAYREIRLESGTVSPDLLKRKLRISGADESFWSLFERYIEESGNTKAPQTLVIHKHVLKEFRKFSELKRLNMDFESLNEELLSRFVDYYIKTLKLTNNTIERYIKILKSFLNWSVNRGYTSNNRFRSYRFKGSPGEIYFLTREELFHLLEHKLPSDLQQARDFFCFSCFTGLRYSDIINLTWSNIRDGYIELTIQKTKQINRIPLNRFAQSILDQYQNLETETCLPQITNMRLNEKLKVIGKIVGLTRKVDHVRFRGAVRLEKTIEFYKILTAHVGRKTFITNSIHMGMNSETVMAISGQKTRQSFQRYFSIVDQHKKEQMDFTWNQIGQQVSGG